MSQPLSAPERRQAIQDNASRMGIDHAFIDRLVRTFYARIRAHDVLSPIFSNVMGDNWEPHLLRMQDFWASVAMNAGLYTGKPVPAHQKLQTVEPAHFEIWLALFQETLVEISPNAEIVPYFMDRANRIAQSLQLAMFGLPGVPKR